LVGFVGLSLLLGLADAAAIPSVAESWVLSMAHPPGMLPTRLIAPTWAVLSLPSGIGAWLVWRQPAHRRALLLWGWHLLASAVWMQCLLSLHLPGPALLAALVLAVLTCLTAAAFARLRHTAGLLLLPTLAWTCYVAYVTAGIWWLNRG
jgi:benzodiazapine receptor